MIMTENHSLGLRASSVGPRAQLNHIETPPPPVLSKTLTQVRGCRNEHEGKPWGKRAHRATVNVGMNRRRGAWQPGSPQGAVGQGHVHAVFDVQGRFFQNQEVQNTSSSAAAYQAQANDLILALPKAMDLYCIPGRWEFVSCL